MKIKRYLKCARVKAKVLVESNNNEHKKYNI